MTYTQKAEMMLNYAIASTAICCVLAIIYASLYRKGKRIHLEDIFICFLIVVISSLRYGVGSDYFRYLESARIWAQRFESLGVLFTKDNLDKFSFEVGYKALAIITSKISDSPYAIFWVVSIVLYIPIVYFCRKYTSNACVAFATFLLFGFWGLSLNIIQQAIAMMFVLFCYEALNQKKYVRFILLAILAEFFHTTAVVAIIIIFVINSGVLKRFTKPRIRNLLLYIAIGFVLRSGTEIFKIVASRIGYFSKYINYFDATTTDSISRKYIMYGALIETAFVVIILYFVIRRIEQEKMKNFFMDDNGMENHSINNIISIVMMGIPFSIIGISNTLWLSNRFAKFFFLFLIVLVPDLLGNDDMRNNKTGFLVLKKNNLMFWIALILWHTIYAVFMLDNNRFQIATYLFR